MDVADVKLLQEIRTVELGERLRAARMAKGWTQSDLAGDLVSVGYVSRLESGQRRPNPEVLEQLASRLGLPVEELLRGPGARERDEIRLGLDYAELALEHGEHVEAEVRARTARDRAQATAQWDLADRGRYLISRALEAQGSIDNAILELEPLVEAREGGILRINAAIALSRCYRESGDLGLAIDTAQQVLTELSGTPLEGVDEAVQLAVTLAAAYYERGDTGQAMRTCTRAIDQAERIASPVARASAYWNASLMVSESGSDADAIPLAERALALLAEGKDGRNLARLRTELADMQLRVDPPEVEAAHRNLELAYRELQLSSAGAVDFARNKLSQARAMLLEGDYEQARQLSIEVHAEVHERAPLIAADAKTVEGQAWGAGGRMSAAANAYREAVLLLTGVGADRGAAQLWFELASLLESVGELDAARDAYRSAAASTGLQGRPLVRNVSVNS